MDEFFQKVDGFFSNGEISKVEPFLRETIAVACETQNLSLKLSAQNELVGFLRSTGRYEEAIEAGRDALADLNTMGLGESVHAATTMLNTATAMRGIKAYGDSIGMYEKALAIYEKVLEPTDYRIAGLFNNMSIVYENLGEYEKAKDALIKAIEIVGTDENNYIELATSYVNLAQLCFLRKEKDEADRCITLATEIFTDKDASNDSHYGAVLATIGQAYYVAGELERAKDYYKQAMENVERILGKTDYYYILADNYSQICSECGEK